MSEAARPANGRAGLVLGSVSLLYLALAIAYQRAVPLFEAPDEPSHIQYVVFLGQEGRPPRMVGSPDVPGEGMEPPLYYLLLQPLFAWISRSDPQLAPDLARTNRWVYRLADLHDVPADARIRMLGTTQDRGRIFAVAPELEYLRALRWGSLVFGALTVLLTFDAARRISASLPFAWLCASLLALSPQFLFVSSYVNNDVACAALGAAMFWLFARAAERGRITRVDYLAAATLLALAFATKLSALPAGAVCGVALLLQDRRAWSLRARDVALAAALGLVLALPSLWMNTFRFGGTFGVSALIQSSSGSLEGFESFGGFARYLLDIYPIVTFRTYWATFGWLNVFPPDRVYLAFFALCWTGLLGLWLGWRAERRNEASDAESDSALRRARALRRFGVATVLATVAAHFWLNLHIVAVQGRHFFGAAPLFASLLALGFGQLDGGRSFGVGWRSAGTLGAGLLGLALLCLTRVLLPAYR
jgi:hypothetical protein